MDEKNSCTRCRTAGVSRPDRMGGNVLLARSLKACEVGEGFIRGLLELNCLREPSFCIGYNGVQLCEVLADGSRG